jgi:transcriptional regulator with XRE-family HTH domain
MSAAVYVDAPRISFKKLNASAAGIGGEALALGAKLNCLPFVGAERLCAMPGYSERISSVVQSQTPGVKHNMVIGERLKQIREHKDWSQGEIEKRTGLLRAYVSRVENGHTVPTLDTLGKWSQALGVSMAELFSENGQTPKALDVPATKTKKLGRAGKNGLRRLSQAFARMNPRNRKLLLVIAVKMAQ